MIAESFLTHLVGDWVLQSDWMARHKASSRWATLAHGLTYTLPFLALTRSPWALLIIGGTHVAIDRYRLAQYVVWARNQLAPWKDRPSWDEAGRAPRGARALALLIAVDQTMHLVINALALKWS